MNPEPSTPYLRTPVCADSYRLGQAARMVSTRGGEAIVYELVGAEDVSIQVDVDGNTWPTSLVLTAEVSVDGRRWFALDPAQAFTAERLTGPIYVRCFRFLRVYISTASSGGTQDVRVSVNG